MTAQSQAEYPDLKPRGFWVSVNNDWEQWAGAEMSKMVKVPHRYNVDVGQTNLLVLDTAQEVHKFHKKYSVSLIKMLDLPEHKQYSAFSNFDMIDWKEVAQSYDGFIVPQYDVKLRHKYLWYNGLDCASGCIWTPKNVILKPVRPVVEID